MSKSHRSLCVSFSMTGAGLCIYHLFVWSNLNFLLNSLWITLLTQSCQVLYFFCTNLQHSLIMWLIFSSLSPHNLHLLFCCVLSILALISLVLIILALMWLVLIILALMWLVLIVLFWAAIRKNTVSLLRFPFLNLVYVFSCEMLLISRLKRP